MIKKIGVTDDLNEQNQCDFAKGSWKSSFVTLLRDLSGKHWKPREDRSLKR